MNGDHIVKEELKQALQSINERLNRLQHQVQSIDTGEANLQKHNVPQFVKNQNNHQQMPYFSSTKPDEKYRSVRHTAIPYQRNSSIKKNQHSQKKIVEINQSSIKFSPMKIKVSNKENVPKLDFSCVIMKNHKNSSLYKKFQPKEFDPKHNFIMVNAPSQHKRSQSVDPVKPKSSIEGRKSEVYCKPYVVASPMVKSSFPLSFQQKSIITYNSMPYSVKNFRQINTPLQFNMINLPRQIPLNFKH